MGVCVCVCEGGLCDEGLCEGGSKEEHTTLSE